MAHDRHAAALTGYHPSPSADEVVSVVNTVWVQYEPPLVVALPPRSPILTAQVLPGVMLRSGRSTPLEGLSIRIAADATDCAVGTWGAWSTCSVQCGAGLQTCTRPVITEAVGPAAAVCPPTMETRACNTCDACSGVSCANGGLCALSVCACAPGWRGADCSVPPAAPLTPFWAAGAWGPCSDLCGGIGTRQRPLYCSGAPASSLGNGSTVVSLPAAACAGLALPTAVQTCNVQACSEQRLGLSVALSLAGGALGVVSSRTPPAALWDALAYALIQDLAAAVGVSQLRLQVIAIAPPAVVLNACMPLALATLTILPPPLCPMRPLRMGPRRALLLVQPSCPETTLVPSLLPSRCGGRGLTGGTQAPPAFSPLPAAVWSTSSFTSTSSSACFFRQRC